ILTNICKDIEYLYIYHDTRFKGQLMPWSISNLTHLIHLTLRGQYYKGSIPIKFNRLVNLKVLNLYHNNLETSLFPSITGLTNLKELRLVSNNIDVKNNVIDDFSHLINMLYLEKLKITFS